MNIVILLKALLIVGLVALNAFFVAAEYALLSVRRTRLEQLAKEGKARARMVLSLLSDVGLLFSGIQLGITVASLLMGWLGETIMADAIEHLLEGYLTQFAAATVAHSISVGTAFLFITIILMVLGELVPKAVAYDRAEQTSLLLAGPMLFFLRASQLLVRALDGMATLVLRGIGQRPGPSHGSSHSPEEVKLIVSAIRRGGLLGKEQEEMIHSVFDLHRTLVREIMVPRPRLTTLPLSTDLGALLAHVVEDQHSRVPIYEGSVEHIVGILYTKDLLRVFRDRSRQGLPMDAPLDLRALLHQPMIVPETMSLMQMLRESRRRKNQMALVVDEFGTFVGVVTIEDVLEQIVGEIQDEYDQEEKAIRKLGENVMVVDASLSVRELADDYDLALPRGAGYETLAGFVLARLGTIPKGGESFVFEGRRYTVLEMEGRRVAKVKVERPERRKTAVAATAEAGGPKTPSP
ncbi:MAG TPA: hemolysin family protein [Terriglobia bacterium]|nr:hemolysin family protein [Terriglobia bacterium]